MVLLYRWELIWKRQLQQLFFQANAYSFHLKIGLEGCTFDVLVFQVLSFIFVAILDLRLILLHLIRIKNFILREGCLKLRKFYFFRHVKVRVLTVLDGLKSCIIFPRQIRNYSLCFWSISPNNTRNFTWTFSHVCINEWGITISSNISTFSSSKITPLYLQALKETGTGIELGSD